MEQITNLETLNGVISTAGKRTDVWFVARGVEACRLQARHPIYKFLQVNIIRRSPKLRHTHIARIKDYIPESAKGQSPA